MTKRKRMTREEWSARRTAKAFKELQSAFYGIKVDDGDTVTVTWRWSW